MEVFIILTRQGRDAILMGPCPSFIEAKRQVDLAIADGTIEGGDEIVLAMGRFQGKVVTTTAVNIWLDMQAEPAAPTAPPADLPAPPPNA